MAVRINKQTLRALTKSSSSFGGMSLIWVAIALVILIAGGSVVKLLNDLLKALGLRDNENDDTVNKEISSIDPNSPWHPEFWRKFLGYYKNPINQDQAQVICRQIWDAIGGFNDDEDAVFAAFKKCNTKGAVSYVVYNFSKLYNVDLLPWLQGGQWPQDRLSNDELSIIIKYVKNLPNY